GRQPELRRQAGEPLPVGGEQDVVQLQQGLSPPPGRQRPLEILGRAHGEILEPYAKRPGHRLRLLHLGCVRRVARVPEQGDARVSRGISSARSCSRLPSRSTDRMLMPVTLPPGRARPAARPFSTGSTMDAKMIGIVAVASRAAKVAGAAEVTMAF